MDKTFEEEINQQIADGYIAEDGHPLKCPHCESKNLSEDYAHEDHHVVEVNVTCSDCSRHVGHWSYGNWMS